MNGTRRTRYWPSTLPKKDREYPTLQACPVCERCVACGGYQPDTEPPCARCAACPFCDGEHYVTANKRGSWREPLTGLPPSSIPADSADFRKPKE